MPIMTTPSGGTHDEPLPDDAPHVLVVDDDHKIRELLTSYLARQGFRVTSAGDTEAARAAMRGLSFDLVLLDVMMPGQSGLEFARELKACSTIPICMLTARADPEERVAGLELGVEDYVAKPFEPRELLARIRVVLRRAKAATPAADILRFGRLEIDQGSRIVRIEAAEKTLTSYQFDLLLAMAQRAGRVLSREHLAEIARDAPQPYDPALDRSIDVHIARIRAAIEDDARHPRRILTVRGVGYVFAKAQS
jgi:DNA-binding response OmpR family regulator